MTGSQTLSGRVVLVTGASSGIGATFARGLARAGARVALAARRLDRLEALRDAIRADGGKAVAVDMDVTRQASVAAAYDRIAQALGPVDSVIANAGANREGSALDLSAEDFQAVFDVNVTGVFLTVREAARRMIAAGSPARRHGRIVIISSVTADFVAPGIGAYAASKAAVRQLGRVLARDWARKGINVNMILPGYIETELNSAWYATELGQKEINSFPRKRLMETDDLLPLAIYLTSDDARAVTGSCFAVDDGQTL